MKASIGAAACTALLLALGSSQACHAAEEDDLLVVVQQKPFNDFLGDVKLERPVKGKTNRPSYC